MRILALLFLIVGVALAGGAVYYASEMLPNRAANVAPEAPKTVKVVAAQVPLRMGEQLSFERGKEVLKFVYWPEDAVPEKVFKSAKELFGEDLKETRTVTRAIEPGELILKTKVTGFGESVRITTQLRKGMRPVTIPINAITGTAGFISPGDFVDVLFTRRTGQTLSSHVLLQNIEVIATDQATDKERNRAYVARTATVAVTPEDAQKLILAMETGTLSLLLRGVNEKVTESDPSSFDSRILPGGAVEEKAPEPEAEPEDTSYRVKVRKGSAVSEEKFE